MTKEALVVYEFGLFFFVPGGWLIDHFLEDGGFYSYCETLLDRGHEILLHPLNNPQEDSQQQVNSPKNNGLLDKILWLLG